MITEGIIVCVVVPLIINGLFKINAPIEILRAEDSAGNILTYVLGAMTFIGTMFLDGLHISKMMNEVKILRRHDNIKKRELMRASM